MKRCPSCAYGNPGSAEKCHVCACPLAGVPERPDPQPEKKAPHMPLAAGALLLCAGVFWLLQTYAWKPGEPAPAAADDASFSYDGVAYSLDKMAGLRFLPEEDKLNALPLLASPDGRVAEAAAKAAGAWARAEEDPGLARRLFEALLAAAATGHDGARRQAALEAGLLLAQGFPGGPYGEKLRLAAGALAARPETELRAAGYFLSAMAGRSDLVPQMRQTLLYDPSASAKLYAACALSRLGYPEGHERLASDAAGPDAWLRTEALSCLSYSASPDADRLLLAAARGVTDAAAAASAKSALILRKQLAIIKK